MHLPVSVIFDIIGWRQAALTEGKLAKISCWVISTWLLLLMLSVPLNAVAQDTNSCGSLENGYGPYDYTNSEHFTIKLPIVERAHFDAGVERLVGHAAKGNGSAMLGGDIDYTLRAFPNHHRALYSMLRYYVEMVPRGAARLRYSAECYFVRAIQLAPTDPTARMLQGIYFLKIDRPEEAQASFERALELAPESAETHYNAGLGYVDLKEYDQALEHALKAYELGYPLMGLKNKLKRLGVWEDSQ